MNNTKIAVTTFVSRPLPPPKSPWIWIPTTLLVAVAPAVSLIDLPPPTETIVIQGAGRPASGASSLMVYQLDSLGLIGPLGTVRGPSANHADGSYLIRCTTCLTWSGPHQLIRTEEASVLNLAARTVLHDPGCKDS